MKSALLPSLIPLSFSNCFHALRRFAAFIFVTIATACMVCIAQEDEKQGLARPEWQLRADLEFRLACQSSLQELCLELLRTTAENRNDLSNSQNLSIVTQLLETKAGKIPSSLPAHSASTQYLKARKAAVIEWNKVYKSKGRDLPSTALDAERKFQETFLELGTTPAVPKQNMPSNSLPESRIASSEPDSSSPSAEQPGDETNVADKKSEKKQYDSTIKNLVSLIKEIDKFQSIDGNGDTTAEKQSSTLVQKRALFILAEKQPDYFLTFPIEDVVAREKGLDFVVDTPIEFEQIQKELGADLALLPKTQSVLISVPAIVKKWKSIKPGDLLRVRFKVGVLGLNVESKNESRNFIYDEHLIKFAITNASTLEKLRGQLAPQQSDSNLRVKFVEKAIVDIQVTRPPSRTASQ